MQDRQNKAKKPSEPMTERQLLTWLRSAMRKASRRYPPIYEALDAAKEPYVGPNPRQKICYRCADCQETFTAKQVAVDHIVDCGSLTSWDDIQGFMQRLFCTAEGLQVLCDGCHDVKTYMTKYGVTKEEAILVKEIIKIEKSFSKEALVEELLERGYTKQECSNAEKRKECVRKELIGRRVFL